MRGSVSHPLPTVHPETNETDMSSIGTRDLGAANLSCALIRAAISHGLNPDQTATAVGLDPQARLSQSSRQAAFAFERAILERDEFAVPADGQDPFRRLRAVLAQAHITMPDGDPPVVSLADLTPAGAADRMRAATSWAADASDRWTVLRNVPVARTVTLPDGTTTTEQGEIDGLVIASHPTRNGHARAVVIEAKATGDLWVTDDDRSHHWSQACSYARTIRLATTSTEVDVVVAYRDASMLGQWARVDVAHPAARAAIERHRDQLLADYATARQANP